MKKSKKQSSPNWSVYSKNKPQAFKFLNKEEKELADELESGNVVYRKPTLSEINKYKVAAKGSLSKEKRLTIRINAKDLVLLQRQALKLGKRYHTLIGEVLHQAALKAA